MPSESLLPCALVFIIVLMVHEAGHYLVARACGVEIQAVSLGFGRELVGHTDKTGTRWRISRLPIGGYVKMAAADLDSRPGIMRIAIMAAGPAANIVFTFLCLVVLFLTVGERAASPEVTALSPGGPAARAGIRPGDTIVSVAGAPVARFEEISSLLATHAGQPTQIVIDRDGHPQELIATPELIEIPRRIGGYRREVRLGIWHSKRRGVGPNSVSEFLHFSPAFAIVHAFGWTGDIVAAPLEAAWRRLDDIPTPTPPVAVPPILVGNITDTTGPGEMLRVIARYSPADLGYFLGLVSINFGLFNLLPCPPLDGWHIVSSLRRRRRRPHADA